MWGAQRLTHTRLQGKKHNQSRRADQAVIGSFPSMQPAHFPSAISQRATLLLTDGQVGNTSMCLLCYLMAVGVLDEKGGGWCVRSFDRSSIISSLCLISRVSRCVFPLCVWMFCLGGVSKGCEGVVVCNPTSFTVPVWFSSAKHFSFLFVGRFINDNFNVSANIRSLITVFQDLHKRDTEFNHQLFLHENVQPKFWSIS